MTQDAGAAELTLEVGAPMVRLGVRLPSHWDAVTYDIGVSTWTPSGAIADVTPTYRHMIGRWYIEGGLGASVSNHHIVGGRPSGTLFEFTEVAGAGYTIGHADLGLYYRHYSNAEISTVNWGHDSLGVQLGWRF